MSVPAPLPRIFKQLFVTGIQSRTWNVKHQRILRVTMLASALLAINVVLKLMFCLSIDRVAGGIFQIANIVPSLIK